MTAVLKKYLKVKLTVYLLLPIKLTEDSMQIAWRDVWHLNSL